MLMTSNHTRKHDIRYKNEQIKFKTQYILKVKQGYHTCGTEAVIHHITTIYELQL